MPYGSCGTVVAENPSGLQPSGITCATNNSHVTLRPRQQLIMRTPIALLSMYEETTTEREENSIISGDTIIVQEAIHRKGLAIFPSPVVGDWTSCSEDVTLEND